MQVFSLQKKVLGVIFCRIEPWTMAPCRLGLYYFEINLFFMKCKSRRRVRQFFGVFCDNGWLVICKGWCTHGPAFVRMLL